MVGVVQRLEHWTVAPGVGGSNPLAHPTNAPVAQLDRASASGAEGRRFESSQARHPDLQGISIFIFYLWVINEERLI